jgi:hypothetical protein
MTCVARAAKHNDKGGGVNTKEVRARVPEIDKAIRLLATATKKLDKLFHATQVGSRGQALLDEMRRVNDMAAGLSGAYECPSCGADVTEPFIE